MKPLMFVAFSTVVALAQAPAPAPAKATFRFSTGGQVIEGQTMQFVSAMNIGPVISGAPYSAEAVNETVQTLADGNRIVESQTTKQYRDSQGRERRELSMMVTISDPVARLRYALHPETKTAEKLPGAGVNFYFDEGIEYARRAGATTIRMEPRTRLGTAPTQLLGTRTIEGVTANGSRTVHTIEAGAIGNERPIEIVDETWTSPELGVTILTTHSDPRSGVTTYKLTNIQRSDPPRSLFEVPADYTLVMQSISNRFQEKQE